MSATTETPRPGAGARPGENTLGLRFSDLLAGMPAVAAAAALAAALVAGLTRSIEGPYEREAIRCLGKNDDAGAVVCLKRLVEREPERHDLRFLLGLSLDRLGRVDEARSILAAIAPGDRTGYPPAHLWMAKRALADRAWGRSTPALVEGHLLRSPRQGPQATEVKTLLAVLYATTGRAREARPILESVAGDRPDRLLELARVCESLGDHAEAGRHALAASEAARALAEARPDDRESRLLWADARVLLKDYSGALRVLGQGDALTKDPVFRKGMAAACRAWAADLGKDPSAKPGERLAALQLGLKYDPANPALLAQVGDLIQGDGPDADLARGELRAALSSGRAAALAHWLLGNDAWAHGREGAARNHWEQAHLIDPSTAVVANNLAWLLAHREPVDLARAQALIDEALAFSPGSPSLRGTRGQILAKRGRWKEAVTELESALAGGEESSSLHQALASAYDHLGMPEIAAGHRKARTP